MGTVGAITNVDLYRVTPGPPLLLAPQPPTPLYRMSALGAVLYSVWNGEGGGRRGGREGCPQLFLWLLCIWVIIIFVTSPNQTHLWAGEVGTLG